MAQWRLGAMTVEDVPMTGGWSGLTIAAGKRRIRVQASPKGAKLEIVPEVERWAAVDVVLPDGSNVRVTWYDGKLFAHGYRPDGGYAGTIDLTKPRSEPV